MHVTIILKGLPALSDAYSVFGAWFKIGIEIVEMKTAITTTTAKHEQINKCP